jgi:hypothetical protein
MAAQKISRAEFEFLARRAGLHLSEQQTVELHGAWGTLEALIERLRGPLDPALEPATMFAADQDRTT